MTTAALRGALVIAAVVLGIFVLARAFPAEDEGAPAGGPPPAVEETPEPEATEPPVEEPDETEPSPEVQGVTIKVLNGTDETGLAQTVSDTLADLGYRVRDPDNAARNYDQTTLFFAKGSRREAQHLRDTTFPGAALERKPEEQEPRIRIIVVVGFDYLQAQ